MVASNLGADASSRQYADAEGRLSLQEVPDKISRIFFGDPEKQYQQGSSYGAPSSSYGAPYGDSYSAPAYQAPRDNGFLYYNDFPKDLELMMKLGHGALIIFMILAVVTIIFLVLMLIMSCSAALVGGKSSQDPYDQNDSAPLRRSSSRSSGGNYQDPNGIRRNGVALTSNTRILGLTSNTKNGYLQPTTNSSSTNQNNLRNRSRGVENLARDLDDLTTSVTSSDTAQHSPDPPDRPLTPHDFLTPTRTRKTGESTPVLDDDRRPEPIRMQINRTRSFGISIKPETTRNNRFDSSSMRNSPIPITPKVPNVNLITATDASSFTTENTVINSGRQLPSPPSSSSASSNTARDTHSNQGWKHGSRADRPISFEMAIKRDSHSSGSVTEKSLDRSMPYYEVPSSSLPYVHGRNSTTHRITASGFDPPLEGRTTSISSHVTFRPPPPVPSTINVPINSSDSRPYSSIMRPGQDNSRLV